MHWKTAAKLIAGISCVLLVAFNLVVLCWLGEGPYRREFVFSAHRMKDYGLTYKHGHPLENSCHLPLITPQEPDIERFLKPTIRPKCPPSPFVPIVTRLNETMLEIKTPKEVELPPFSCAFRSLQSTEWKLLDFGVQQLEEEQVEVHCTTPNGTVFHDLFAQVIKNDDEQKAVIAENDPHSFHFVLLVLDSVSHTQFLRHAKQTSRFLIENGAVFMRGFATPEVGVDSTLKTILGLDGEGANTTHSLMDGLEAKRYTTMLNHGRAFGIEKTAEGPENGTLAEVSFDHDFNLFYNASRAHSTVPNCLNGRQMDEQTLELMEKFSTIHAQHPHFSVNVITSGRSNARQLEAMDERLLGALRRMDEADAWNRTHPIRSTSTGQIEQRTPLLAVRLPKKFVATYPQKQAALEANGNRLITPADLHSTLRRLLALPAASGRSLLAEIPKTRTCESTGIPARMCPCLSEAGEREDGLTGEEKAVVLKAAMLPIERKLNQMGCVHAFRADPPENFRLLELPNQTATNGSVQSVQFEVPLSVEWDVRWTAAFRLQIRVNFDRRLRTARLLLRPLVRSEWCDEQLLERICRCIWRI